MLYGSSGWVRLEPRRHKQRYVSWDLWSDGLACRRAFEFCVSVLLSRETDVSHPSADMIDIKTQEIKAAGDDTFSDLRDLADELPDSSPRFILLSYPMTLVCCLNSSPRMWPIWCHPPIMTMSLGVGTTSTNCHCRLPAVSPFLMSYCTICPRIVIQINVCPTLELLSLWEANRRSIESLRWRVRRILRKSRRSSLEKISTEVLKVCRHVGKDK